MTPRWSCVRHDWQPTKDPNHIVCATCGQTLDLARLMTGGK